MDAIDPIETALQVSRLLDELNIQHTIGGSIASSFAGEPRSTLDIDVIAAVDERNVEPLVAAFSPDFYIDAEALRRAIRTHASTNLIHQRTQLKVDLFVAGGTPLDTSQLARRLRVDLGDGRHLYVHPPEDILLQKLRWYHQGGAVSDRQWRDIAAIVRVQAGRLDVGYLRKNATVLGVSDLLERALREQELTP